MNIKRIIKDPIKCKLKELFSLISCQEGKAKIDLTAKLKIFINLLRRFKNIWRNTTYKWGPKKQ